MAPKTPHFLLAALLLSFSSLGWSLCNKSEVVRVLDSSDYSYEPGEEDGDYNFFLTKGEETIFMWVEPDGDMSFRKVYSSDIGWAGVDLQPLMVDFKYIAAYFDSSNNVAFSYDVRNFTGECPDTLANNIDWFFGLMEEVEVRLHDMWSAVKDEVEEQEAAVLPVLISI